MGFVLVGWGVLILVNESCWGVVIVSIPGAFDAEAAGKRAT